MTTKSIESEQGILGAILLDESKIIDVMASLALDDFSQEVNRVIYQAMLGVNEKGQSIDFITVLEESKQPSIRDYMASLISQTGTIKGLNSYIDRVLKTSTSRKLMAAASEMIILAQSEDPKIALELSQDLLTNICSQSTSGDPKHIKEVLSGYVDELEDRDRLKGKIDGLETGFKAYDERLKGIKPTDLVVIAARPSMGKAQPLTSKVLLADGSWKLMGDIKVGDGLSSVDGKYSVVDDVYPQGVRPVNSVLFSDGRKVECDSGHLWTIKSSRFTGSKVVDTDTLKEMIEKKSYKNRITIESHSGDFGTFDSIGISPWLLGYLLGDGCLQATQIRYSASEDYILKKVNEEIGENYISRYVSKNDYRIIPVKGRNEILGWFDYNCLKGKRSYEKIIPEKIFECKRNIRAKVLQGLLESDGWVQNSSVQFSSSSKNLSMGVQLLVRSLGGTASMRIKEKCQFTYKGEKKNGRAAYVLSIALSDIHSIVESPRLMKNLTKRKKPVGPFVRSVNHERYDHVQCIKVSHKSSLYITDNYTATHNTTFAINIVENAIYRLKKPGLVFSMEMSASQISEKMVSSLGNIHLNDLKSARVIHGDDAGKLVHTISNLNESQLYVDDSPGLTISDLASKAHKINRKVGGLSVIMVDYIGLMEDHSAGDNTNLKVTRITSGLKRLAKTLNVPVIALSQLNRGVESRNDKRPMMSDLRDSGSIEQDADIITFLYRDEYYNKEMSQFKGITEAITAKFRMGETGTDALGFEGHKSRFTNLDYTTDLSQKIETKKSRGVSY